jgi:hypothetical protein
MSGVTPAFSGDRERGETAEKTAPIGGVGLSVKGRGGERGWAAARLVWAPGRPRWADVSSSFFCSVSLFSFYF